MVKRSNHIRTEQKPSFTVSIQVRTITNSIVTFQSGSALYLGLSWPALHINIDVYISIEIVNYINTLSCIIKVNCNTIELTVHTSCYCVLELLCINVKNGQIYFILAWKIFKHMEIRQKSCRNFWIFYVTAFCVFFTTNMIWLF